MEGYRARDWAAARAALATIRRTPALRQYLADALGGRRESWAAELAELAAGQGAIIAEQAYDLACTYADPRPRESFERQLLWRLYWDEVAPRPAESRAAAWLGYLFDRLRDQQGEETEKGLDWVRFRLPHQPAEIRACQVARKLAELASDQLGVEIRLFPGEQDPSPPRRTDASHSALTAGDFENRDLYAQATDQGWYLSLDYLPLGPPTADGPRPRVLRMRVPNLPQQTIVLRDANQENDASSEQRLRLRQGERYFWSVPTDRLAGSLTTITGRRYDFSDETNPEKSTPAFWRSHFRRARSERDLVAQRRFSWRWASFGFNDDTLPAPRFHALAAAAITEEAVDQADSMAVGLVSGHGSGGGAQWRRILASYYRFRYADIDSRIDDAKEHGAAALALLGNLSARPPPLGGSASSLCC